MVLAGIVLCFALFLVLPVVWRSNAIGKKLAEARQTIQVASHNIEQLPTLREEEKQLNLFLEQTRNSLFSEAELGDFIGDVSEIARNSDVQITSSKPNPLTDYGGELLQKKYEIYQYELELESDYDGFGRFLAELYRMPKLCKVQNLSILGREVEDRLNRISLSFLVVSERQSSGEQLSSAVK